MCLPVGIDVPIFNGAITRYKEFKKRCILCRARMKLDGKEKQVALSSIGQLTGAAWETCESLIDKPDELEKHKAFADLTVLVGKRFSQGKRTELPDVFEQFVYKFGRKLRETLFDYVHRTKEATKNIAEHNITLPDTIRGWLLLHNGGFTTEQKTLVMTQTGK